VGLVGPVQVQILEESRRVVSIFAVQVGVEASMSCPIVIVVIRLC